MPNEFLFGPPQLTGRLASVFRATASVYLMTVHPTVWSSTRYQHRTAQFQEILVRLLSVSVIQVMLMEEQDTLFYRH